MTPFPVQHADRLGLALPPEPVTLGEGHTPLIDCQRLARRWGLGALHLKAEQLNPTGSYKDRFAVFVINRLLAEGQRVCLATSSGNTGAALAAYGAAAGLRVVLAVTEATPSGKLSQMAAHGARLLRVAGFGREAVQTARIWARLQALAEAHGLPLVVSAFRYCPDAMRGVATLSLEIVETLGGPPDACFVPVGGGGLYLATALGFDLAGATVRVEPVQPVTNDTVVTPLRAGLPAAREVNDPRGCRISGLAVPTDIDGTAAVARARSLGARGYTVTEEQVWETQRELYRIAGIGVEPAGAVALAGVRQALDEGRLGPGDRVVALLTGHGFKDPAREEAIAAAAPVLDVTIDDVAEAAGLEGEPET